MKKTKKKKGKVDFGLVGCFTPFQDGSILCEAVVNKQAISSEPSSLFK